MAKRSVRGRRAGGWLVAAITVWLATTGLGMTADASQLSERELTRLRAALDATREDPLRRADLQQRLAAGTPDAFEALDLWTDLAATAPAPEQRQHARERAAVLALLLGQRGRFERLLKAGGDHDGALAWLRAYLDGERAPPPWQTLDLDPRTHALLQMFWANELRCRKQERGVMFCP